MLRLVTVHEYTYTQANCTIGTYIKFCSFYTPYTVHVDLLTHLSISAIIVRGQCKTLLSNREGSLRDVNKATEYKAKAKAKAKTFKAKAKVKATSKSPRPGQGQGQKQIPKAKAKAKAKASVFKAKAKAKANVLLLLLHTSHHTKQF